MIFSSAFCITLIPVIFSYVRNPVGEVILISPIFSPIKSIPATEMECFKRKTPSFDKVKAVQRLMSRIKADPPWAKFEATPSLGGMRIKVKHTLPLIIITRLSPTQYEFHLKMVE